MSYTKKQKKQLVIADFCSRITKSAKIKPLIENQIKRSVRRVEMRKGASK